MGRRIDSITKGKRWPWVVAAIFVALVILGAALPGKSKSPAPSHASAGTHSTAPASGSAPKHQASPAPRSPNRTAPARRTQSVHHSSEPASEQEARAWINEHERYGASGANPMGLVKMAVENVFNAVSKGGTPSSENEVKARYQEVAAAAEGAGVTLEEVRNDFGHATKLSTAVAELKKVMGDEAHTAEGFANSPAEANVEQFMSRFSTEYVVARNNWNEGVERIWRLAHEPESVPPTLAQ